MSRCLMPRGASASITALTTAGVEAIVPVSPAPLTPSGLTRWGVSVRPSSKLGKKSALGQRVVHQRAADELAVVVVDRVFPQRLRHTLHDSAVNLALDDHAG